MTTFFAALVPGLLAFLPLVLVPRRRRALSLLRAEVDLLNVMPEGTNTWDITEVVNEGASRYFDRYISKEPADVLRRRIRYSLGVSYSLLMVAISLVLFGDQAIEWLDWNRKVLIVGLAIVCVVGIALTIYPAVLLARIGGWRGLLGSVRTLKRGRSTRKGVTPPNK